MRNIQNINIRYGSGVPVPCDPELVMAINGQKAALNFFSVKDNGELRTVVYDVMDVAFEFKISDAEVFTEWIEDRYMERLDADSWYGFKDALERAKNQ